jgi:hypothetical protein
VGGHKLVVGVEDNQAKDKSDIVMITFDNAGKEINKHVIAHRSGTFKRSTAGAVGFTQLPDGRYLVAVGDWDSRAIDFYRSRSGDGNSFDSICTYHAPDQGHWCSYQSVNLLTDTAGKIFLIGFGLDGTQNRSNLFEVKLSTQGVSLVPVSTVNFKCKGGAGFRYGAGLYVTKEHDLIVYSCSRGTNPNITVNVFK